MDRRSLPATTGLFGTLVLALLLGTGPAGPTPQQTANAKKGTVTGQVLLPDGKPAAKLPVRLSIPPTRRKVEPGLTVADPAGGPVYTGGTGPGGARPVASTVTDEQGRFKLVAAAGKYQLYAGNVQSGTALQTVTVEAGKALTADLKLAKGK